MKGSFREFTPADIIQMLHLQRKSGRLTVRAEGRDWVLGFEDGRLVQANCGGFGAPRLGEILVRQGYLDRETLAKALTTQAERPRHLGAVLEEMGIVTHSDIARALSFQLQEIALNLFFLDDGDYVFERVPVNYDAEYTTPVNTEFILMEGARRVDEWPAIHEVVGGGDAVFERVNDARPARPLVQAERTVLDAVDGLRDVNALVSALSMGLFETCRILAQHAGQGLVRPARAGNAPLVEPISGTQPAGINRVQRMPPAACAAVDAHAAHAAHPAGHAVPRLWWLAGALALGASVAMWAALGRAPLP
ncbi:MAG: DUF4388 domain-containing protein [Nitrospirae bacterium]|nr:DUF4388 domain-containing protein [Nitrospirota bacterium]